MTKINIPSIAEIGPFYDNESGLVYIFPPSGPTFQSSSNSEFFTWAAQIFLCSTSTDADATTLPNPVSSPSGTTPYVFNSEFFYRYSNSELTPQSANRSNSQKIPSFSIRKKKAINMPSVKEVFLQPGKHVILISQGENKVSKKESLVYYGIHTNRVFGYEAAKNLAVSESYSQFPTESSTVCSAIKYGMDNGYAKSSGIPDLLFGIFRPLSSSLTSTETGVSAPSAISIPDLDPAVDFLSMAVELKKSWIESNSLIDRSKYVLQVANVPTFTSTTKDGSVYWKQTGEQAKKLACMLLARSRVTLK